MFQENGRQQSCPCLDDKVAGKNKSPTMYQSKNRSIQTGEEKVWEISRKMS